MLAKSRCEYTSAVVRYDYNHKTYTQEQKDLPATKVGDIEWNGFEYGGDLNKGFELYATTGGKNIRVSCCGFKFDSPEAKAFLLPSSSANIQHIQQSSY